MPAEWEVLADPELCSILQDFRNCEVSGLQDLLPIVRSEDEARAMLARKTAT
jgi:hypothetical protein